ncbi:mitochondrial import inner membrane translocase subunit Tim10-like [Bolinopsis microptera]|uniref:mitochondrial import inner membrane translocase subunit Tim10-like n=1 Tax=Bolinopsis microptera TaxID=2820187 RepID=UPI00307AAB2E
MAFQPRLSSNQQKQMEQLEMDVMQDMYNRLSESCRNKCISKRYDEGDLSKAESVCLDRCAAKYLEVYERVGKKLTAMYTAQMAPPEK